MLNLSEGGDWWAILLIGAAAGAAGGLISELLLPRLKTGETGALEHRHALGGRYTDLGSWAAVLIGALAGPLAAFLIAPGPKVTGGGTVTRDVDISDVIVIAAIAGIAGSRFLGSLQERFSAIADATKFRTTQDFVTAGIRDLEDEAKKAKDKAAGKPPAEPPEAKPEEPAQADAAKPDHAKPDHAKPAHNGHDHHPRHTRPAHERAHHALRMAYTAIPPEDQAPNDDYTRAEHELDAALQDTAAEAGGGDAIQLADVLGAKLRTLSAGVAAVKEP